MHKDAVVGHPAGFWGLFSGEVLSPADGFGPLERAGETDMDGAEGEAAAAAREARVFTARVGPRAAGLRGGSPTATGGQGCWQVEMEFKPAGSAAQLRDDMPHIGIPSYAGDPGEGPEASPQLYFGLVHRLPPGRLAAGAASVAAAEAPSETSLPSGMATPPQGAGGRAAAHSASVGISAPVQLSATSGEGSQPAADQLTGELGVPSAYCHLVPSFQLLRPQVNCCWNTIPQSRVQCCSLCLEPSVAACRHAEGCLGVRAAHNSR